MKKTFLRSLTICVLSLMLIGQGVAAFASEPVFDFNGNRYTRAEFLERYGNFNMFLDGNLVSAEVIFDLFAVTLLDEYRLTEDAAAEWINNFHYNGGISRVELQLLYYTNIERARVGVPPLQLCPTLSMAARFKAEEMAELRYFAHESPVYGHPQNISLELFGIEDFRSENLTRRLTRQRVAFDLVQSWLGSPGHRANMLDPGHRYLGVGIVENVMGMGVNYDGTPIPDRYATLGVQKFR